MFIFKALQHDPNPQEYLCLEEFMEFYTVQNLQWKQVSILALLILCYIYNNFLMHV